MVDGAAHRVSLRRTLPEDEPFLRHVHDTSRDDLATLGLPADALETLLRAQYMAMRAGWASTVPAPTVQIVELDGAPCGWLVTAVDGDELLIVDVVVLPHARGARVATSALRSVVNSHGECTAVLHVQHGNPARRLYERLGFVETARDELRARMERPGAQANVAT